MIGYGEKRPMHPNTTAEGRNANRRVVVVILSTELMRQTDPAKLTAAAAVPGEPAPSNLSPGSGDRSSASFGPGGPAADRSGNDSPVTVGGAIASPGDSPQAVPVATQPLPARRP